MRVAFAGTPEFAVPSLSALIKKHDVAAVYTQPDRRAGRGKKLVAPPIKELAEQHQLVVLQPPTLKEQAEQLRALDVELMVVVAYGMLLPPAILAIPRYGCVNVHGSVLPRWRGAAPIQRAIEAGDTETGVSIMQMAAGLDTGPVYQILKAPITDRDTSASLHDKLAVLGAKGLLDTLDSISNHAATPTPQNDALATYAKKISKAEGEINWQLSAAEIERKSRAFIPWPICQSWHQDKRMRVWQASVKDIEHQSSPGTVIALADNGIEVACGAGILVLEKLQREGGKVLHCQEFLNGFNISIGDRLEAPDDGKQA